MVRLPNFLLIGAMKAGTTSLYYYLQQHPNIFMSRKKEPQFFAYEDWHPNFLTPQTDIFESELRGRLEPYMVTEWEDYLALFRGGDGEAAIGEASTTYLHLPRAIDRIRHYIPRARLFAVLRHPADRAYSAFLDTRSSGAEPIIDFRAALAKEDERIQQNWNLMWAYRRLGFYAESVRLYLEAFGPAQIRFYLYEDLKSRPRALLRDIFEFLEVDPGFEPNLSIKHNVSRVPKNLLLEHLLRGIRIGLPLYRALVSARRRQSILRSIQEYTNGAPPGMPLQIRVELTAGFREDILKLQDLIDRDLSHWLDCEKAEAAKFPNNYEPVNECALP